MKCVGNQAKWRCTIFANWRPETARSAGKTALDANHDCAPTEDPRGLLKVPHGHPAQSPKVEDERIPESRMMRKYHVRFGGGLGEKEHCYLACSLSYPLAYCEMVGDNAPGDFRSHAGCGV